MITPKIAALDHLVLTVADIAQTVAFYCDVLGMQVIEFATADSPGAGHCHLGRRKSICIRPGRRLRLMQHFPA